MIQVPMFHCFGMVLAMTASMTHGVTMSPIPAFAPKKGLACINREKITCFHGVPTMFIAMLGHEDFEKTDFSHMRTGIMAVSYTHLDVYKRQRRHFIRLNPKPAQLDLRVNPSHEDNFAVGSPAGGIARLIQALSRLKRTFEKTLCVERRCV